MIDVYSLASYGSLVPHKYVKLLTKMWNNQAVTLFPYQFKTTFSISEFNPNEKREHGLKNMTVLSL